MAAAVGWRCVVPWFSGTAGHWPFGCCWVLALGFGPHDFEGIFEPTFFLSCVPLPILSLLFLFDLHGVDSRLVFFSAFLLCWISVTVMSFQNTLK